VLIFYSDKWLFVCCLYCIVDENRENAINFARSIAAGGGGDAAIYLINAREGQEASGTNRITGTLSVHRIYIFQGSSSGKLKNMSITNSSLLLSLYFLKSSRTRSCYTVPTGSTYSSARTLRLQIQHWLYNPFMTSSVRTIYCIYRTHFSASVMQYGIASQV
jgi:hypothetical protein